MKIIQCFLLLAMLTSSAFGEEAGHPLTLWEVQGASNSIYLLGSIHLLRRQDHPLPTAIETAYEDAEALIMELDLDDLDPLATQAAFNAYGLIQDGSTLREMMGEDQYQRASEAASEIDIPLDMLDMAEPWLAAITIEIMSLSRLGFDPSLGIETYISSKAIADGKPIEGFETVDEQLTLLDGISLQGQRDMLLSTLEESASLAEMMDELILAWRHGDIALLESEMLDSLAEHEELMKVLVTDRNTRWVERIDTLLNDKDDYLIVVGALHLIGDVGVPHLLAKKGLKVQQLSEPSALR